MARWVRVSSAAALTYVNLDKAVTVGALEDPNIPGSFVVAVWFESSAEPSDYQTIQGAYTTLVEAESVLQALIQGYDPTA